MRLWRYGKQACLSVCVHVYVHVHGSVCCLLIAHARPPPPPSPPSDIQAWYTLWLSDWGPRGKAGWLKWRGVVCIPGHFMKKGCNHGSKPRGGLNYAWLNKAQGYQRAMSQQSLPVCPSLVRPDSHTTVSLAQSSPLFERNKQTSPEKRKVLINHWIVLWHPQALSN